MNPSEHAKLTAQRMARGFGDERQRLLDTFAAAALTGFMARTDSPYYHEATASEVYEIAEAMLAERSRRMEAHP